MFDMYQAALDGLAQNDLEDAISTLIALWEERENVDENDEAYEAVLAGGVLLSAHVPMIDEDSLDVDADPEAIQEYVSSHRDRLSEPVRLLLEFLADEATEPDPEGLRAGIDLEDENLDLEELEAVLISDLLEYLQSGQA